jgi:hypothetical protein
MPRHLTERWPVVFHRETAAQAPRILVIAKTFSRRKQFLLYARKVFVIIDIPERTRPSAPRGGCH